MVDYHSYLEKRSSTTRKMKSTQRRRKHCVLAVVRRSEIFLPHYRLLPGMQDGQNLISWRWSLYLYLQTQFGKDRCTQFRVIMVTDPQKHTHKPTDRTDYNTLHAALLAHSVTIMPMHLSCVSYCT